ncbi:hypothetical protein [Nocardioides sp. SYSU D00038]|uniref:hypothetical protein n=1 Tax=Nocardioides sp. SYSU D00038 TaxID=2812554 RepID=UPI001967C124|nr:hypothetical protein [Nocardioides sp. SYSU D00038]
MAERWPPLDDLDPPVWDLPPAAEVRRRGQDLSRRRTRTALGAALGTAALVAVPTFLVAGAGGGGTPVADGPGPRSASSSVATDPGPGGPWLSRVPAGLDVTAGMTTAGGRPVVSDLDDVDAVRSSLSCGEAQWVPGLPPGVSDLRLAVGDGARGSREDRLLLVYADPAGAGAALAEVRQTAGVCGEGPDGREAAVADDVRGAGAEESWAFVVSAGSRTESVLAVRVGNAVLLDHTSSATARPAGSVGDWLAGRVRPVVDGMCVFAADPC